MRFARLALATLALVLAGCRSPLSCSIEARELARLEGATLVGHPELPRARGNEGCGSQALAVALAKFDPSLDVQALSDSLPWHEKGANVVDLIVEARRRGYRVSLHKGTLDLLRGAAREDRLAIVLLDVRTQVWTPIGWVSPRPRLHWAVVGGLAEAHEPGRTRVVLAARGARRYLVREAMFDQRWEASGRCTILVEGKVDAPREAR